jgi:predicted XRE-type DNA-binding protein
MRSFESAWDAIEADPGERQRMKILSGLMMELTSYIERQSWTQREAASRFGVSQPRISDLVRGKINLFSIDALIEMSGVAGLRLDIRFGKSAHRSPGGAAYRVKLPD